MDGAWGIISAGEGSGGDLFKRCSLASFRCRERSHLQDCEDALEYVDEKSEGSYHTPKIAKENSVPLPIELTDLWGYQGNPGRL